MIDLATGLVMGLVPHVKALHLMALILWCGGLFALPLTLALHDTAVTQADYSRIRQVTHFGYIFFITPAALVAIGSGTALIFLREVYVPWLFAKLVFVALLVGFHAWIGAYARAGSPQATGCMRRPGLRCR
jgi:protoporphyrinogen IX oxidase